MCCEIYFFFLEKENFYMFKIVLSYFWRWELVFYLILRMAKEYNYEWIMHILEEYMQNDLTWLWNILTT